MERPFQLSLHITRLGLAASIVSFQMRRRKTKLNAGLIVGAYATAGILNGPQAITCVTAALSNPLNGWVILNIEVFSADLQNLRNKHTVTRIKKKYSRNIQS